MGNCFYFISYRNVKAMENGTHSNKHIFFPRDTILPIIKTHPIFKLNSCNFNTQSLDLILPKVPSSSFSATENSSKPDWF